MNYKAPYCDHCGAEFEPMENPRNDCYDAIMKKLEELK